MEHIAPLIQTFLWVALIAGIVWRFHLPIDGILTALQKRVEAGSNIKAGPFEITDQLKPQDPVLQKAKVATEIQEALKNEHPPHPVVESVSQRSASVQARYFQAEDLVLRAIQTEYGSPVNRQVTAGRDDGFDGLFVTAGRTTVVEVKYISGEGASHRFQATIKRTTDSIQQYGWQNPQIVLALVFERSEDIATSRERLSLMFAKNPVPVIVRCFTISELQAQFGIGGGDRDAASQETPPN